MRIVQIFRAPLGGLFRHVRDLTTELAENNHDVAIICDAITSDGLTNERLEQISQYCNLGIHKMPIPRLPGPHDLKTASAITDTCRTIAPDILHGHGAKGGLFARLCAKKSGASAVYSPHGGVLHFNPWTPRGALYLGTERFLTKRTNGFVFVCQYERNRFHDRIGGKSIANLVAHNGLLDDEFKPAIAAKDATDILYLGELRHIKGIDVLLNAIAKLHQKGIKATATFVGDGPDGKIYKALATKLGLDEFVRFTGAMPAEKAFQLGRVMVLPSRRESFSYVALEGQAAQLPFIGTNVGGIAEMINASHLTKSEDVDGMADALARILSNMKLAKKDAVCQAKYLQQNFSTRQMVAKIENFYREIST